MFCSQQQKETILKKKTQEEKELSHNFVFSISIKIFCYQILV